MNRTIPVLALFVALVCGVHAQELQRISAPLAVETDNHTLEQHLQEGRAIPGCRFFMEKNAELAKYAQQHPEMMQQQALMKRTAWNFTVGSKGPIQNSGWWATNLETNSEYLVPATCRAVSDNAYFFVEDALWNSGDANQVAVDSIVAAWESRTPANPSKGIFQLDTETFGFPDNVDSDGKIIILILDIKDGAVVGGGYVAGYFYSLNQFSENAPGFPAGRHSNFAEIYYLDGKQSNLKTTNGVTTAAGTTAHEFQHMINWNHNGKDGDQIDSFSNESQSEAASLVCGYSYTGQSLYTNNTDTYLFDWPQGGGSLADYSRAARWGLYLWNQFPGDFLKQWVQGNGQTFSRINGALLLTTPSTSRQFAGVFNDFVVANYLQDYSLGNGEFGYTFQSSLTKPQATTYVSPNTGVINATVNRLGADYISFTGGTNLSVTFTSQSGGLAIKAIKTGASAKVVENVTLGAAYNVPDFGSTYTNVTFVVINTTTSTNPISYSYSGTGNFQAQTFEVVYDDGLPEGYLPYAVGDIQLVYFDGIQGAKLDSIRVAFRRAGTMQTVVRAFSGTGSSFSLGATLVPQFTVTSTDSTRFVNGQYPVPYENWVGINLKALNLDVSNSFAILFTINNSAAPGIMVSTEPNDGNAHSLIFISADNQWYLPGVQGDPNSLFRFLVRAYASIGTTVGTEVIELLPASFSLRQNYPNPFNPSTTISYDLPERGYVKLQIFDMLGRVVTTLIDAEQSAGAHKAQWDGTNLSGLPVSSGVYFYKLQAGSFNEIKRMVLMK